MENAVFDINNLIFLMPVRVKSIFVIFGVMPVYGVIKLVRSVLDVFRTQSFKQTLTPMPNRFAFIIHGCWGNIKRFEENDMKKL